MDASQNRFFRLLEVLVRHEVEFVIVGGVAATLIEVKERVNRDKDRAVLPILRRTLEMKREEPG